MCLNCSNKKVKFKLRNHKTYWNMHLKTQQNSLKTKRGACFKPVNLKQKLWL